MPKATRPEGLPEQTRRGRTAPPSSRSYTDAAISSWSGGDTPRTSPCSRPNAPSPKCGFCASSKLQGGTLMALRCQARRPGGRRRRGSHSGPASLGRVFTVTRLHDPSTRTGRPTPSALPRRVANLSSSTTRACALRERRRGRDAAPGRQPTPPPQGPVLNTPVNIPGPRRRPPGRAAPAPPQRIDLEAEQCKQLLICRRRGSVHGSFHRHGVRGWPHAHRLGRSGHHYRRRCAGVAAHPGRLPLPPCGFCTT